MEMTVTQEKQNPLLGRDEYEVEIDHSNDVTPARDDVRTTFATEQDFDLDTVLVESINSQYGSGLAKAIITVWEEPVHDDASAEPDEEEQEDEAEQDEPDETDEEEQEDDEDDE